MRGVAKEKAIWWDFRNNQRKEESKRQRYEPISRTKATGPDEVPAELIKAGGETVLDRMHRICVAIWETDEWPEEWTFSAFIPLPQKVTLNSVQIKEQLVSLVSQASKILLRIILEKIRVKTETEIAGEQAGFRKEMGTRDQSH